MTRTSFAQVRAAFVTNTVIANFKCIANPYNRYDCPNDLEREQTDNAERLLRRTQNDLNLDELRDIINCLLCADCQRTYTHKTKVEKKWRDEFPEFDFSRSRSPSPYSLVSGRLPSRGRRQSRQSNTASHSSPSPSTPSFERTHTPAYAETPSPQPNFTSTAHEPSSSVPEIRSTPEHMEMDSIETQAPELQNETSDVGSESPLAARGRYLTNETQIDGGTPSSMQTQIDSSLSPNDVAMTVNTDRDAVEEPLPEFNSVPSDERPNTVEKPNLFQAGKASTWAPWTIRSELLSVLLQPLPKNESTGSIYAVRVRDTPYVKIGYTVREVKTRIREITVQHRQELETSSTYWLFGIPLRKLQRLEATVHADLAYFQRNLRVQSGRSTRTRQEYFEVDLAIAQRSIKIWWSVLQNLGLEPGRDLDPELCNVIKTNPALDIEVSEHGDRAAEPELWHGLNSDHNRREDIWKNVFKVDQGGLKKLRSVSSLSWFFGLTLLIFLLGTVDLQSRMSFLAASGLAFALSQWKVL